MDKTIVWGDNVLQPNPIEADKFNAQKFAIYMRSMVIIYYNERSYHEDLKGAIFNWVKDILSTVLVDDTFSYSEEIENNLIIVKTSDKYYYKISYDITNLYVEACYDSPDEAYVYHLNVT